MATGVDISNSQGTIDFSLLKNDVDFVIIRAGWGSDDPTQDDPKFLEYVAGCQANNIPFGLYLYSYALTNADCMSEVNHMLRLYNSIADKTLLSYGLWFDMEDVDGYKANHGQPLAQYGSLYSGFCNTWVDNVKAVTGGIVGVYASLSPLSNELSDIRSDIPKWVAFWGSPEPSFPNMFMWQYTNQGSVSGIAGRVDMDVLTGTPPTPTNTDKQVDSVPVSKTSEKTTIKSGATDLNSGSAFADWVYNDTFDIIEVNGNRVVFGKGDAVTGVCDISYTSLSNNAISDNSLHVGDTVIILDGAKDLNSGVAFAAWVYNNPYTVIELQDRGVCFGRNGVISGITDYDHVRKA